jgi:phage tail protein X
MSHPCYKVYCRTLEAVIDNNCAIADRKSASPNSISMVDTVHVNYMSHGVSAGKPGIARSFEFVTDAH